jgi:hypothetical protein
MQSLDRKLIEQLKEDNTDALVELDKCGLLPAPGEELASFKKRLLELHVRLQEFHKKLNDNGKVDLFPGFPLKKKQLITKEIISEAAEITQNLFEFSVSWVPGFFLSKSLGLLWGGCAFTMPDSMFSVFLIRRSFTERVKWFIYRRDELLAHELSHAARGPLHDMIYEEHFAYMTAPSRVRRYMGNCFRTKMDAMLFLIPVLVLLTAQSIESFTRYRYEIWPFWIAALAGPAWLIFRNQLCRNIYFKAVKTLKKAGIKNPRAVLFRCTTSEMREIAKSSRRLDSLRIYFRNKSGSELRWQVIMTRFINPETENMEQ